MELDIDGKRCLFDQTLPDVGPASQYPDEDVFWRHFGEDLHCSYPTRSGDDRSVTLASDFYSLGECHNSAMYGEYMRYFGAEHEAMVCLSSSPGRSRRLLFTRGAGRDFDARARLLLAVLRPHLHELDQEIQRRLMPVPDLTLRQWELMRLIARGHTNAEIAGMLFISPGTVRKHLENIFARLGATTRMAAVATAFPGERG